MSGDVLGPVSSSEASVVTLFSSDQLIELLNRIRGAAIPKQIKLSLRDLVLEYAQATSSDIKQDLEAELLDALDDFPDEFAVYIEKLQTVVSSEVVAPSVTPEVSAAPAVGQQFSRTRPRPVFGSAAANVAPVTPSAPPPEVTSEPTTVVSSDDAVQEAAPMEEMLVTESTAPEPSAVANESSAAVTPSESDPLVRIKEIKRIVNEKVGNPVNLIDADNNIGREYMNALLDAMKKLNGAEPAELTSAMERLEAAFAAVEAMTAGEISPAPAATATPEPEPVPTPDPTPMPATPLPATDPVPATLPPAEHPEPVPAPAPKPVATEATAKELVTPEEHVAPAAPSTPSVSPATPESVSTPKQQSTNPAGLQSVGATPAPAVESAPAAPPASTPAVPVDTDPLHGEQVTGGLHQLLSEWKLFKSSGLFGTGPSGKDHPLYQLLSGLPMSSVIAGRFEGATPEIKQNIADYMNGWRYEQGMVHEMDETFDHYLRRVISVILEKQPPKKELEG